MDNQEQMQKPIPKKENPARILILPNGTRLEGDAASQVDLGASKPFAMTPKKEAEKQKGIAALKATLPPEPPTE